MGAQPCNCCTQVAKPGTTKELKPGKKEKKELAGGDKSVLQELRQKLKGKFKTEKAAFEKLDGSLNHLVNRDEFRWFMTHELGQKNNDTIDHLFDSIDDDGDNVIELKEFKDIFKLKDECPKVKQPKAAALIESKGKVEEQQEEEQEEEQEPQSAARQRSEGRSKEDRDEQVLTEFRAFKEQVKGLYHSGQLVAMDTIGNTDAARINKHKFRRFFRVEFGHDNEEFIDGLFHLIDHDGDSFITRGEFKAFLESEGAPEPGAQTASPHFSLPEFREKLKHMFKTQKGAFERLGGGGDAQIDKEEFRNFVRSELGQQDATVIDALFNSIDVDKSGCITAKEFKALFQDKSGASPAPKSKAPKAPKEISDPALLEFRKKLKGMYKSPMDAFKHLGGGDDKRIDREEFQSSLSVDLGQENVENLGRIFDSLDSDGSGFITGAEFKALFQAKASKETRAASLSSEEQRQAEEPQSTRQAEQPQSTPVQADAQPQKKPIPDSAILEFGENLRGMFKSNRDAFVNFGGEDSQIEKGEFLAVVKAEFGDDYDDHIEQIFDAVDGDGSGCITGAEFKALFEGKLEKLHRSSATSSSSGPNKKEITDPALLDLRAKISVMFHSEKEVFSKMGGEGDGSIDQKEFERFLHEELGLACAGVVLRLWKSIDEDDSGVITREEFENLFSHVKFGQHGGHGGHHGHDHHHHHDHHKK